MYRPFHTLLVANRGEIACRVLRTANALGYRTVAVFSEADSDAPHVAMADEAVGIGPAAVSQSYLDAERILDAARRTGADAIHPGYGFLSENADFARACADAGIVFVGPTGDSIGAMGDKAEAKSAMRAHDVPVVPGVDDGDPTDDELIEAASDVGFPLLVKAAAGGGGRGMRRVDSPDQLADAIASARAEATAAFGSGRLLLERLVEDARHVEIQILGDSHGNVVHLFERDCSVQRRHQKVVEEAPSPAVTPEIRAAMGEAACRAAAAVDYCGAGTVEFLLGADGEFYFLEMNTRLQVEHPVTEAITGLDLVELQLRVASGEPLPFTQDELEFSGHAIEVRLYAEDPSDSYLPQTGTVHAFEYPDDIRVDHGIVDGIAITPHYDPMIAKLIASGPTRDIARRKLLRALEQTAAFGIRNNLAFLRRILANEVFAAGGATTHFLSEHDLSEPGERDPETHAVAVVSWFAAHGGSGLRIAHGGGQPVSLAIDGDRVDATVDPRARTVSIGDTQHTYEVRGSRVRIDGVERSVTSRTAGETLFVAHRGDVVEVARFNPAPKVEDVAGDGNVRAPSAAQVLDIRVAQGDAVAAGDPVCVVEAMKLETTLRADVAGTVAEIRASVGDSVAAKTVLVVIEPDESDDGE
jgi:geranyl-CoA carboxylase alpha subunit